MTAGPGGKEGQRVEQGEPVLPEQSEALPAHLKLRNTAIFKWRTKILKKNPAKLRGIHLSLNAHKLQPVHSSTPHLYIHNIESITLGCEVRGIYPLDISPRPGQREVKQFLREGQGTTAQRGSASRLASHSPGAPRDRQTSNVSSSVREVPTPASTLTPGCLLLPTLQKEKKKSHARKHPS